MSKLVKPVARLEGVSHRYGTAIALDGVSLGIPSGVVTGFIGPDGVGKSSVLALIAGARHLQQGRVEVLGSDLGNRYARSQVQPRIAYMPQGLGRNLYASLSVFENVDFFGRLFGHDRRERERRITALLTSTGLEPFRDRPVGKLSGGMKQKLGLCCALIHDPDLLILDEPTTGVDPLSRRHFWELIDGIRADNPAMSVVVATAYMEEAERFDWLVAMDGGRVIGTGTPAELMAQTGSQHLEQAFIALLPEEKRHGHVSLEIPPWQDSGDDPVIEAENLCLRFGDFIAVDRVSFRIRRGEIFGFLGSNGCGKTTTMKMLTGLLPPTSGEARLFGQTVHAHSRSARRQVGYMSQSFSLYGELTIRQNLDLHARLFHLPAERREGRIEELLARFGLTTYADVKSEALPLGIRQRLSLAVALVHEPPLLILDEPTSGVDPIARDDFWALLVEISRQQGVTIFISTHFMNEAERCDRISLMHAGKVLASDTPAALVKQRGVQDLEQAFIAYLEEAAEPAPVPNSAPLTPARAMPLKAAPKATAFSLGRLLGYAYREGLELMRDPIRITFALLGSALLLTILGYGISMDVRDMKFAVLDRDNTPASRDYIANIAGSRYFIARPLIRDDDELTRRMQAGELALAIEIPLGFGADLKRGRAPEVSFHVDGAMPFRGETIRGYATAMHNHYVAEWLHQQTGNEVELTPVEIQSRFRYNQDFRSLDAMVPAVIPLLLIFIPAILTAVGVVREKELGSITNLYVTPVTRLEFLLGKQLPYIAVSMFSMLLLVALAVFVFEVPLKGSLWLLAAASLIYIVCTTGIGLLISTFTRSQVGALAFAGIFTMLPTVTFSGLTMPTASLEGASYWIGQCWPATYMLIISRGIFSKAVNLSDLYPHFLALLCFIPVLLGASVLLLKKQED